MLPHQSQDLATDPRSQPEVQLRSLAEVTGAWSTTDKGVLQSLSAFHVWGPAFNAQRLGWRHQHPVTVLEMRVRNLLHPVSLASVPEYWGCFSWVKIHLGLAATEAAWSQAVPALSDSQFSKLQQALRHQLSALTNIQSLLS